MKYSQITLEVETENVEVAENICQIISKYGIWIENNEVFLEIANDVPKELIDENLLELPTDKSRVHFYISEEENPTPYINFIDEKMKEINIPYRIMGGTVDEEEYANNWKQYYKPVKPGKKIVIVPSWERYEKNPGEITIDLDPGMAFGTGLHESTRLCINLLEKYLEEGNKHLDIGCGSGILSIAGVKLGASKAVGTDIDPLAIKVAKENAKLNDVEDKIKYMKTDLTVDVDGKYDVITANIVADIIIRLMDDIPKFLNRDGVFITSGIIDDRKDDVMMALSKKDFVIIDVIEEGGWVAIAAKLP